MFGHSGEQNEKFTMFSRKITVKMWMPRGNILYITNSKWRDDILEISLNIP